MNPQQPVSFPGWKAALASSNLSPVVKTFHTKEIITFLHHCKKTHSPASVGLIKQWLSAHEAANDGPAHTALRWFYRCAPKEMDDDKNSPELNRRPNKTVASGKEARPEAALHLGGGEHGLGTAHAAAPMRSYSRSYNQRPPWRPMEPRPASQDLGGPDWEPRIASHAAFTIGVR